MSYQSERALVLALCVLGLLILVTFAARTIEHWISQ
jgi:hypothetical protein